MAANIILENYNWEELKKLDERIQAELNRRKELELEEAQEALRAFLKKYEEKGIRFYEPDGYGKKIVFSTTHVFADERW